MTVLFWSFVGLIIILLLCVAYTHYYRFVQLGSANWENPDQQALQLTNRGARAWHAQSRTLRAILFLLITVSLAKFTGVAIADIEWQGAVYAVLTVPMIWLFIIGQYTLHWMLVAVNAGIISYMLYQVFLKIC